MNFTGLKELFKNIDWVLFGSVATITLAGLVTMNSFVGQSVFFNKQIIWIVVSVFAFFIASNIDWGFLKNTRVVTILFFISTSLLFLLFVAGNITKGAQS